MKSYYTICVKSIVSIIVVMVAINTYAQNTTISPYSRVGIGDMDNGTFSRNFAMGRTQYALSSFGNMNPFNPASYEEMNWTQFEVGVMSRNYWLYSGEQNQAANVTHFNNLALGFPITDWWGLGFGVMPFSSLGYDYSSQSVSDEGVAYSNDFTGSGGINRVYLGQGIRIKKLQIGFNFSYLFGKLEYEEVVNFKGFDNYNNTASVQRIEMSDMYLDFGVKYNMKLGEKTKLNIGAIYVPEQQVTSNESHFDFTFRSTSSIARIIDTLSASNKETFSIILPAKYGVGILLNRSERTKLALDLEYEQWSRTNFNTFGGLNDTYGVRLGGEFTQKDRKYKIRFGGRINTMSLNINEEQLTETAVSLGFAFPFRSKDKLTFTELNIAGEFGQRGKDVSPLLLEQFINVQVGLTLSNKWFIKRKYD